MLTNHLAYIHLYAPIGQLSSANLLVMHARISAQLFVDLKRRTGTTCVKSARSTIVPKNNLFGALGSSSTRTSIFMAITCAMMLNRTNANPSQLYKWTYMCAHCSACMNVLRSAHSSAQRETAHTSAQRKTAHTSAQRETAHTWACLLYTSPSPRDRQKSRMPSSA